MERLIDFDFCKNLLPIESISLDKYNLFIKEAEEFEIYKLLTPDEVFIIKSDELALNGGEYQYNGIDYRVQGFKNLLVYLSFRAYLSNKGVEFNQFGIVFKKGNKSDPVKQINDFHNLNENKIQLILKQIVEYLKRIKNKCINLNKTIEVGN